MGDKVVPEPVVGRIESWKESAAYVHRDVRTCQRWEKEFHFPIHRLSSLPRSRVFDRIPIQITDH